MKSCLMAVLTLVSFAGQAKTLFLAGDSTMYHRDASSPFGSWGDALSPYLRPDVSIDNRALSGYSTKSFIAGGKWSDLVGSIAEGDYVIIQFGHNDQKREKESVYAPADGLYGTNLRQMVEDVRAKRATPVFATSISRRTYVNGRLEDLNGLRTWAEAMIAVAVEKSVECVDMNTLTRDEILSVDEATSLTWFFAVRNGTDFTHPTKAGASRFAPLFVNAVRAGGLSIGELFAAPAGFDFRDGTTVTALDGSGAEPLSVGYGTVAYTNEKPYVVERPVTNTVTGVQAVVYDVRTELVLGNGMGQGDGAFVKTGPGTLRLRGGGTYNIACGNKTASLTPAKNKEYWGVLDLNESGKPPVYGFGGFTVAEGTVVLGEDGGTYVLNGDTNGGHTRIGCCTTTSGQELSGTLEIRGGSVTSAADVQIGQLNGTSMNTPNAVPASALKVYGGQFTANCIDLGRFNTTYSPTATYGTQNTAPRIEVHGGVLEVQKLWLASDSGCEATVLVDGGELRVSPDVGGQFYVGRNTGAEATVCHFDISGSGILRHHTDVKFCPDQKGKGDTLDFRLRDGGTYRFAQVAASTGVQNFTVDGGYFVTSSTSSDKDYTMFPVTASILVGAKGGVFQGSGYRIFYRVKANVKTAPGIDRDGGLVFMARPDGKGSGRFLFSKAMGHNGPTRVEGGDLAFTGDGRLSPESELVLVGGSVCISNGAHTVAALTVVGASKLVVANKNPPLTVTGPVSGPGTLTLDLRAGDGVRAYTGNPFMFMKAPAEQKDALLALSLKSSVDGTEYLKQVTVSGETATLSLIITEPVDDLESGEVLGEHTVCVFDSKIADPDLSTFLPTERWRGYRVTYAARVLEDGPHVGKKAIVATVSEPSSDGLWTAVTSGGAWSESANWGGAVPPNGVGKCAAFGAAGGADVPVTVDSAVTLNGLFLADTEDGNGYAFSGRPLAFGAPAGSRIETVFGTHTFAGGIAVDGEVDISNTNGATVKVTGPLTGSGRLSLNVEKRWKGGRLEIEDTEGFAGSIRTGSGTVALRSMAFASDPDQIELGPGTLAYTGSGETAVGFTVNSARLEPGEQNRAAVLNVPAKVQLAVRGVRSSQEKTCAVMLTGGGSLRFVGNGEFQFGTRHRNAINADGGTSKLSENGDAPSTQYRAGSVIDGKLVVGTVGDANDAPQVKCPDFGLVGVQTANNKTGELEMNNGSFEVSGDMYLAYRASTSGDTHPVLTMNGGSVFANRLLVSSASSATSKVRSKPEVHLNGGSFGWEQVTWDATLAIAAKPEVAGIVWFNGGTLEPGGTDAANRTLSGFHKLYASGTRGAISTARLPEGAEYTLAQAVESDPSLAGPDAGLAKTGSGTLVIASENAFMGDFEVREGTVRLDAEGSFEGPIVVDSGATLDLSDEDRTLNGIGGSGTVRNGNVTVAAGGTWRVAADGGHLKVLNGLAFSGDFKVDVSGLSADDFHEGTKFVLATCGGTISGLPESARVRNAAAGSGLVCRLNESNGTILAEVTRGGLTVIIR